MIKRLSEQKYEQLFSANFVEKKYKVPGIKELQTGWFSNTDGSIFQPSQKEFLRTLFKLGFTEKFEKIAPENRTSQIAYNPLKKQWVGFSHRAYFAFGIGYRIKTKSSCWFDGKGIGKYLPGFICQTTDDCKNVAKIFAQSVS